MDSLSLSAKLEDVARNIKRWNQQHGIGLVEAEGSPSSTRVVWEAGNCALFAERVDDRTSELSLVQVKDTPPDAQAASIWNRVGALCAQVGWVTTFQPLMQFGAELMADINTAVMDSIAALPAEQARQLGIEGDEIEEARERQRKGALPTSESARSYIADLRENADGTQPGQMPPAQRADASGEPAVDIAILTVLPEEYKAVYDRLHNPCPPLSPPSDPNLYAWVMGEIPHLQTGQSYVAALGMMGRAGTDLSALATSEAITLWKPTYVLFVGIAGGFDLNGLQKGDVVVADLIYGYEYGKLEKAFLPRHDWVYRTDMALVNGATAFYTTNPGWADCIQADHPQRGASRALTGPVASGDKVVDDPSNEFFAQVRAMWPKLQAVEMEGAGAAAAIEHGQSKGRAVGFLMIRGMSDMPVPPDTDQAVRGTRERDLWKPYAAEAAATFAVSFIAHGLPLPPRGTPRGPGSGLAAAQDSGSHQSVVGVNPQVLPVHPARQPHDGTVLTRRTVGSPFVVGRPLRADEPIFGREMAFRFVADQLAKYGSVNLVAERRMGKTSLLNHLIGHAEDCLIPQPDQPPLVLAWLDLQAQVTNQARFYGMALRELLDRLPPSLSNQAPTLQDWRARLHTHPEADYDEFQRVLRCLHDPGSICARPVLVVDEFERLFDAQAKEGFPFPGFFDGVRALITADLLAMIVASRRPLVEYFCGPARTGSLTSTFPSYFTPFRLSALDVGAADALLLQASDRPLTLHEAAEAKRWAGGHPCLLQAAGQACYEARSQSFPAGWARQRFQELKSQNCMPDPAARPRASASSGRARRFLRAVFWRVPLGIGRLAQRLEARLDDLAAWIIGVAVIVAVALLLFGAAKGSELWAVIKKGLGLE